VASADNQTGLPIGLALTRAYQGIVLEVFKVVSPTLPQVAGVLKKIFLPLMIGMQQYAGLSLVVLWRLARGRTKLANLLPEGSQRKILSLLAFLSWNKTTPQLVGFLVKPL
jgi:hypothetical protein